MNIAENICPVCKESNELEAVICGNCGAVLENPLMDPENGTETTNIPVIVPKAAKDWSIDKAAVPDQGIAVFIEGEFDPVHIDSRREFVIGRRSKTTSKVSDGLLDLSPQGAYGRGVSRRHVVIRLTDQEYEILDLGSVNGTWLNDKRLVPHKYYPLDSGSHLRLGSMRLLVLHHHPQNKQEF
jgi:hypothetical protein